MHSLIVTTIVCVTLLAGALGLGLPYWVTGVILTLGVALIGLPHGALDHRVGQRLFRSLNPLSAMILFFMTYLGVAAVVVLGWFVSPLLTISGFFCLSAWHFGLEEDERRIDSRLQWLAMVARGGMVIWVPTMFQGDQITKLLTLILPSGDTQVATQIVVAISIIAPLLALLTIFDAFTFQMPQSEDRAGVWSTWQHRVRLLAFAILFATADPLVSFGIYFCGWHSIRGLVHLREQSGLDTAQFLPKLIPISVVAIGMFGAGYLLSRSQNFVTPALLQTVFIGLSAVAIPHLLLHIVADSHKLEHSSGVAI